MFLDTKTGRESRRIEVEHIITSLALSPNGMLDGKDFMAREKAKRELAALDDLAEPQLRKVVASKPSLETRLRVE